MRKPAMLNLNRLRLLHELSVMGSITAVAKVMGLTRPAISQQLALLEKEMNEALLERSSQGVRLTPAGERLASRAAEVFGLVDRLESDLQSGGGLITGEVRVSAFGSLATGLAPLAFRNLREQHPQIALRFTETESNSGLKAVVAREIDLAVIDEWADVMRPARPLEFAQLGEDRFVLVVASTHPLANRRSVRLRELAQQQWVINQAAPAYRAHLIRACQAAGFTPNEICNCSNMTATIEFVRQMGLVTVLPSMGLGWIEHLDGVRMISLNPPINRKIRAAMLPNALARPAVKAALQALKQAAAQWQQRA
ncbi:LysR substrate-binding domain protein [Bordetella bronchiseptica GA96-01]|nr:LysR family transcriptional regulator [Bordetella bronchiseptica]KCV44194.1 LysR substrate-binding domain protein [Bordetella bronchiseptica 345]KDC38954.1 LysR substrate-binding domain protein [Bordetella bronchiseptica GA96-01]QET69182.1 LysR family transcriptional regulator [Bordetella bronchiseptica]